MLVVLDTNVLVSGLGSVLGASNAVLRHLAQGDCRAAVSTALCLEYEDVLHRPGGGAYIQFTTCSYHSRDVGQGDPS